MSQFKKKDKYRFWYSPITLLTLFCVLVIFSYNTIGLVQKERETNKKKISELNKIEDLRKREANLVEDINRLNTDIGIEESIRDKFQVVKPGEKMVVIVDEKEKDFSVDDTENKHGFWEFIKRIFKK